MTKWPTPAAALLAVDAADRQAQDLYLQLWVRVDLGTGMGETGLGQSLLQPPLPASSTPDRLALP